ncbi:Site-specific recombinase XerD [Methanosarcina thermophila]|jgi:integrase/recombinase XerD|uniref:Integrase n=2 Tax=Methanosarcina thermophila TaxID=2210 RepID=A0A1I7AUQ4_METTE|nr:tyrosine-type recombinase/integrase [Methanosarcina thermophila]AKB13082.1 Integrase [Methanosarcina thermophila TM-1]SFT78655.1 Site-specific recombinase XerD [Methanosarcina thermophila]BAW28071.1 integrase [Methanosarcina thermophila]HOA69936.1 tyrosine-type recombinase/integrase [Methanosarcina thermophila]HPT81824.1 tyrosine-type recombinase/integrase [Methanosarcina thermophila]
MFKLVDAENFLKSEELSECNREILSKYFRYLRHEGNSERTALNHMENMIWVAKALHECDLGKLTEDDLYLFFDALENYTYTDRAGKIKKYSEPTKETRKVSLKKFLKWNKNYELHEKIKCKRLKGKKLPEDIKCKEDIVKMIEAGSNSRDRAIIACFYESGARRGEQLSVKLKNVELDEYGAVITFPEGKTGARRVRLVFSAPYLREWIDDHPRKDERDAPLWCTLDKNAGLMSVTGLVNVFNRCGEKAGIEKKVNPHSFRHDRATHLATNFTEQQLKMYLGWSPTSTQPATYVHLSGKNMDDAVLKMYGIKTNEDDTEFLKPGVCPRCHELTPVNARFCLKCGLPLSREATTTVESIRNDYIQFADLEELREMKDAYRQGLEEISKLKEKMLKSGK